MFAQDDDDGDEESVGKEMIKFILGEQVKRLKNY
jgi:hypothetical protein